MVYLTTGPIISANNLHIVKKIKREFSYCFRDDLFDNYSNLGTLDKHLTGKRRRVITSRALGQGMWLSIWVTYLLVKYNGVVGNQKVSAW